MRKEAYDDNDNGLSETWQGIYLASWPSTCACDRRKKVGYFLTVHKQPVHLVVVFLLDSPRAELRHQGPLTCFSVTKS